MFNIIKNGIKFLIKEGVLTFLYIIKFKYIDNIDKGAPYYKWIKENEKDIKKMGSLKYKPFISIIVPVYNVTSQQLNECIESVINQTYDNWELCLVDDASTWENVNKTLKSYEKHKNIKISYRLENGHISKATNDGIEMATGEFIAFLDCDDILSPNALYEMARKLNENPEYDFIYSDEDKITEDGKKRHSPFFKPDWSPDTLNSLMYTCHFAMYRKSIVREIGGLKEGYEGAQDYDFTLRFTEKTNNIGHIAKILYHWRERKESTALNIQSKPYIFEATKNAKEDALKSRNMDGRVEFVEEINQYRMIYTNNENPKVSIIIPSKDNFSIFSQCINSIIQNTLYPNYEIVVVDNGSSDENKQLYLKFCEANDCSYHYEKMDFNFSKMCNIGSRLAKGEYYLFLNDDIEVTHDDWLNLMVGHAGLPHIGAVGAKLYYPNSNIIQHTGVVNLNVGPSHSLVGFHDDLLYYYCRNRIEYNYIAVTGACLLIQNQKYKQVNGFDETFPIAYNDVDLCFKLVEKGYYNVVRSDVKLYHHESVSRGYDLIDDKKAKRLKIELKRLYDNHPEFRKNDPFYNPNLTQSSVDFSIKDDTKITFNKAVCVKNKKLKDSNDKVVNFIDSIIINDNSISISGWGFIKKALFSNLTRLRLIIVSKNDNMISIETNKSYRPDVTKAYGHKKNYNFSGFQCCIDKKILDSNEYKLYVSFKNLFGKEFLIDTGRLIEIN